MSQIHAVDCVLQMWHTTQFHNYERKGYTMSKSLMLYRNIYAHIMKMYQRLTLI